jgi:EmrB/QacA subfamily drug resistance transporter
MGGEGEDPKRWLTLAVLLLSLVLVVLDNTVLNVAVPTMVRELGTNLASIQWVIAGYSLVFASLLVIGGRLGDLYGPRRMFITGAALFGVGSALASVSHSVGVLIVGESVVEGIGAALMQPASLSIITNTFKGHERSTAFATWGATMGAGMAFGPVIGGYLTTYHSWRWAFRINVIVAPIAVLGAWLLVRRDAPKARRDRLDAPGAFLVGIGTFCLVFGISESERYGWTNPLIPGAFLVAVLMLAGFVVLERRKEREDTSPLFEFGQLRHLRFRYGLVAQLALAMGQMGQFFVMPVFLQDVKHLTPARNGLWMLPVGVSILVFAQLGGRLTKTLGTTTIVRVGLVLNTIGLLGMTLVLRPDVTFLGLMPVLTVFGCGVGLASSQLTNLILADIAADKSGVASGANTTVRQVGSAIGVALMGAIIAAGHLRTTSRTALFVATGILAAGTALAFLIPTDRIDVPDDEVNRDLYDVLEPVDSHLVG